MLYIGVDLGTSAVKLLLMDESGKVLNIVSKEYPISFPKPGWSEQNPCDWWEQTVAGLIELTKILTGALLLESASAVRCMDLSYWMKTTM